MSDSNIKEVRKQIRNIVKELLPEVMSSEIMKEVDKTIKAELVKMNSLIIERLKGMDERHKDTMGYLVRQSTQPAPKKD